MDQREKERLLNNLRSLPNELEDLLGDLDEEVLRWRPIPNKWSIKEIMCHLRDMELLAYLARYKKMLSEDSPLMEVVDQNRLADDNDYINQDTLAALHDFQILREETVKLLGGGSVADWSRLGIHQADGAMTVEQLVNRQINGNDINHLTQMKDIVRLKMPW